MPCGYLAMVVARRLGRADDGSCLILRITPAMAAGACPEAAWSQGGSTQGAPQFCVTA
jgi:hypothetical protein